MADGSPGDRAGPKQMNDITFSAPDKRHSDTKQCSDKTFDDDSVNLSFYKELNTSESCEKSDTRGVAANRGRADELYSQKSSGVNTVDGDDRKKRCFDRYDSSESSDSGVAVLSPTESGGCSGSDITEPRSPCSPEPPVGACEEGAGARMPPWAHEPAPRRAAPRRITQYFNHKMKPQNSLKHALSDDKKKCLPKNGVKHDLEKYISYLSQTLSPKVLMDVKQTEASVRKTATNANGIVDSKKTADLNKVTCNGKVNGMKDFRRPKDMNEKTHTNLNGFLEVKRTNETLTKEKRAGTLTKGLIDGKKQGPETKTIPDPSANGTVNTTSQVMKRKVPIPAASDLIGLRIAPATSASQSPKKMAKTDTSTMNGVVSSTTKLDSRMNGVTCGSNNLNLNPITKQSSVKKETLKKPTQSAKKTNRKSSACIANSKNLTWSKANNLKQVQLQKQNNSNTPQNTLIKPGVPGEASTAPKMNIPNGVRQVSMTVNGSLGNLNVPVTNLQNCHQINIPQPCNGTVQPNNLASFVAVPQNVMLTALRIPQNSLSAQTFNNANLSAQQNNINNMSAFSRPNVNVSSPTKLNGQFVFPLVQNINGTVVQIPNLMAKMPNFVLPQASQLTSQRQDHLQNQQGASILINGTLLKLANPVTAPYTNVNKPAPVTSQSIPVMNKNIQGIQTVGMTVSSKPNYAVNFSHPVLMPQSGFIVTSVPNINMKETWSYSNTHPAPSPQTTCSNPIVHHPPPIVANFTTQALHTSSIPIAPVKPPDNPIQGTDPPSSTVKEPEFCDMMPAKCDIPWLSKTVNNNIVTLESNKMSKNINLRPFAHISSIAEKLGELAAEKGRGKESEVDVKSSNARLELTTEIEKVNRREDTIFTQITVLKEVSSDVHNTVIETNFCGTTTESESGIGTDKSIDSPSDSQTSKECDEDSSLSLCVSLSSVEAPSQKSPILKQPKTLRFPPRSLTKPNSDKRTSSTDTTSTVTLCYWENCKREFDSDSDLIEHLQNVHVETQAGKENYVCLWEQCKVRGKPSCSRLWLERHTLSHGGNKPFKCIVDGCDRRFSTQILLERHVNNHFNESSSSSSSNKKTTDSAVKLIRRNGKKLRYRRQPWSARMFDFFDAGMMEGLVWRLVRATRWRLCGACPLREPRAPRAPHALCLRATLCAARYNAAAGRREALVSYYPPHVLEDEWVPESDVKRIKRVDIASLPASTKVLLYSQFCASYRCVTPNTATNNTPVKRPEPRRSSSSRALSALLAKRRRTEVECRAEPLPYREYSSPEVSGAKKRKLGRRYGGNSFWPCGR